MVSLVTNIQGYSIHDGPGIRTVVFLKGCGLACRWCSNPECISPQPEIGFFKTLCTKCGKCAEACPAGALVFEEGQFPVLNRELCTGCGVCSSICSYKAMVLHGKPMSAEEIYAAVSSDKMFYEASGGGVTFSGGEALLQPQLVSAVFEKCRHDGINTCIETSGYVTASNLNQVLRYTDYVLFDLKHLNTDKHFLNTGKPNDLILDNAKVVADMGKDVLFRMPVIPGINDDMQNIKDTADFLKGLGTNYQRIELMPYHRLGQGKYAALDKPFLLPDLLPYSSEQLELIKKSLKDNSIECSISR